MNVSKKIISIFLILLFFIGSCSCFAITEKTNTYNNSNSNTTSYKVIIEDDADLLTQDEEEKLKAQMNELTEYGNILFKSINQNSTTTANYASNYYHNKCGTQSGTVFLIDMAKRKIYIFSDGSNYKTITTGKAETITDNIYTYATKKQYYQCAKEAFTQIHTILEGGKIAEPMKYISNAVISVMIALFINFLIFRKVTKVKPAKSGELLDECEKFFEHTPVEVVKTGEHSVYSPIESSSGGGSSGGGGGRRWIFRRWRRP